MKITEVIVKRPMAALMIIIAIVVFGFMSITNMEQESMPSMEMPMMIVVTTYTGADPENVDKLVTQRVEGAIGTLNGLDTIMSMSMKNFSMVYMQYEYGTDMNTAYIDLKESMDRIRSSLPDDAGDPMVMQISNLTGSSMSLSVSSQTMGDDLLHYVEDELSPEFEKLSAVADISVYGGKQEYISVELREDKMQQYGLNMNSIISAVSVADFSMPSGNIDFGSQTFSLTSGVTYRTVQDLRNLPIALGSGNIIRLEDVANVYDAVKDADSSSRYNGEETISISLTKRQSASAVSMSEQVKKVVQQINATESDLEIEIMYDESDTIQESIMSVAQTLILGIVISMVILFLFFGNIRASLIVGSSMPVSLLVAFMLMNMMGFTLNIITMGALVLGVGMMVDNSIVVLDSCFKSTKDRTFRESAVEGARFVMLSIIASTITTVVVFLPLAFTTGMVGEIFKPLGYTVAFSLIASLFSAMTLVPLFFVQFKPIERKTAPAAILLKKLERGYVKLLRVILNKKKTVFAISMAIVVVAVFVATGLNMELIPMTDEGVISISIDTRPGMQLEKADAIVREVEELVAAHEDVDRYSASAGGGSFMGGSSNSITAYLKSKRKMSTAQVVEEWRLATANMTDCDIDISSSSSMTMGMVTDTVDVSIQGSDFEALKAFSEEIADIMRQHPDMIRVTTSLSDGDPQMEVVVDPIKAAARGMSPQEVASYVYRALNGAEAATITRDGRDYKVTVEFPRDKYVVLNDLENMILVSSMGQSVPLLDIASVEITNSAQSIYKEDNQYNVSITGTPAKDTRFAVEADIRAQVAQLEYPDGITPAQSSMTQMMNEAFASIGTAIVVAILLVFMVMTIQFESIKHSLMVMVCIPFCLIGAVALLALTGTTLNMTSLLGFLVLVGTVVNNGILFVDTTNQYRKEVDVKTALIRTGRHRLRPILMTTLTTVLSMIPMAMGLGTGSEMMSGMGLVVIGGLTASTILTLLLLPTFYLVIDGNPEKKQKRMEKKLRRQQKQEEKFGKHMRHEPISVD